MQAEVLLNNAITEGTTRKRRLPVVPELGDKVFHKFSTRGQWTLCPVNVFGIIMLFERCQGYSRRRARSSMNVEIR